MATKKNSTAALSVEELARHFKELKGGDFIGLLQSKGIRSPLVIVGEEALRIRRLIGWLRDRLAQCTPAPNVSSFSGSQLNSAAAVRSLIQTQNTMSLFAPVNIVLISEIELIKAAAGKPLVEALRNPSPCSFVIATGATPNQKTVILNELLALGTPVQVDKLSGESLRRWISQEVARLGISGGITSEATELLVRSYENSLDVLAQDMSRLALLLDEHQSITAEVAKAHFRNVQDHTSFELLVHIARKNLAGVHSVTTQLLAGGLHPLQLCSFLSRAVRIMLAHSNPTTQKLPADLSNSWILRQVKPTMSLLSETDLKGMLYSLLILDELLKSSGLPAEELIELHLMNMALRIPYISQGHSWILSEGAL